MMPASSHAPGRQQHGASAAPPAPEWAHALQAWWAIGRANGEEQQPPQNVSVVVPADELPVLAEALGESVKFATERLRAQGLAKPPPGEARVVFESTDIANDAIYIPTAMKVGT